ncbi:hypothetical protein ACFVRD_45515 [Streptomyces sp. NPDC057908]|uniref:hypothetical protein n=1 Tax=Streptomyces sp. NPDC057908 TaxID=3346276 RepID=UPI0036E9938B
MPLPPVSAWASDQGDAYGARGIEPGMRDQAGPWMTGGRLTLWRAIVAEISFPPSSAQVVTASPWRYGRRHAT